MRSTESKTTRKQNIKGFLGTYHTTDGHSTAQHTIRNFSYIDRCPAGTIWVCVERVVCVCVCKCFPYNFHLGEFVIKGKCVLWLPNSKFLCHSNDTDECLHVAYNDSLAQDATRSFPFKLKHYWRHSEPIQRWVFSLIFFRCATRYVEFFFFVFAPIATHPRVRWELKKKKKYHLDFRRVLSTRVQTIQRNKNHMNQKQMRMRADGPLMSKLNWIIKGFRSF